MIPDWTLLVTVVIVLPLGVLWGYRSGKALITREIAFYILSLSGRENIQIASEVMHKFGQEW